MIWSCSSSNEIQHLDWPPNLESSVQYPDSINAAYDYLKAESLFVENGEIGTVWRKALLLYDDPNSQTVNQMKGWVDSQEDAINSILVGVDKEYCDFSFGNPKQYRTFGHEQRRFDKLANVMGLLLIKAWIYHQDNLPENALEMYSASMDVLNDIESQLDDAMAAKISEIIYLSSITRSLLFHIQKLDSTHTQELRKTISLIQTYLENRQGMERAFHDEIFQRSEFTSLPNKPHEALLTMIPDPSPKQVLDFEDAFEDSYEQEYLRGTYDRYQAVVDGFQLNEPPESVKLNPIRKFLTTTISSFRGALYIAKDNMIAAGNVVGRNHGNLVSRIHVGVYEDYIENYYISDAQLRIALLAAQVKLEKYSKDFTQTSQDTFDPFNKFKPLRIISSDRDIKVYSFGPDRKDGNGDSLKIIVGSDENVQGIDIGYTLKF